MAAYSRGGFGDRAGESYIWDQTTLPSNFKRVKLCNKPFPRQKHQPNPQDLEIKPSHGEDITTIVPTAEKLRGGHYPGTTSTTFDPRSAAAPPTLLPPPPRTACEKRFAPSSLFRSWIGIFCVSACFQQLSAGKLQHDSELPHGIPDGIPGTKRRTSPIAGHTTPLKDK